MKTTSRWITASLTAVVAALAIGQASAQYGYSSYGYGYGRAETVRCESVNSRSTFCRVNTSDGVSIARQLSERACIEGYTWDYNDRGIWVSGGCRADFVVRASRGYRHGDRDYDDRTSYDYDY
jgi:hypothetical protein